MARELEAGSQKELRESADRIKDKVGSGIILLGAKNEGKVMLICMVTKDLVDRFRAGDIIRKLAVEHQTFGATVFDTKTQKMSGYVAIVLNDRLVESLNGLGTFVKDGDVIKLFPVIAGG